MTRISLTEGVRGGAPFAFGALVFLAGVVMAVIAAAALLLATLLVV